MYTTPVDDDDERWASGHETREASSYFFLFLSPVKDGKEKKMFGCCWREKNDGGGGGAHGTCAEKVSLFLLLFLQSLYYRAEGSRGREGNRRQRVSLLPTARLLQHK
jgi:hypothetical protein